VAIRKRPPLTKFRHDDCDATLFWGETPCPKCGRPVDWRTAPPSGYEDEIKRTGAGWAKIHHVVRLFGPVLGPYGLAMYLMLNDHANTKTRIVKGKGRHFDDLVRETGMSRAKAVETIGLLEAVRLISVEHNRRAGNEYYVEDLLAWLSHYRLEQLEVWAALYQASLDEVRQTQRVKRVQSVADTVATRHVHLRVVKTRAGSPDQGEQSPACGGL
jgi:hypothetical protein